MSVRSDKRKDSQLEFINSAHELEKLSIQLTVRENAIPKRYRIIIGKPLCDAARALNRNVIYANAIYPTTKDEFLKRREYQQKAKLALYDMFEIMRLASELLPIKSTVLDEWVTIANKEQRSLASWMQSDKNRYKDLT